MRDTVLTDAVVSVIMTGALNRRVPKTTTSQRTEVFTVEKLKDSANYRVTVPAGFVGTQFDKEWESEVNAWLWLVFITETHISGRAWKRVLPKYAVAMIKEYVNTLELNDAGGIKYRFLTFPEGAKHTSVLELVDSLSSIKPVIIENSIEAGRERVRKGAHKAQSEKLRKQAQARKTNTIDKPTKLTRKQARAQKQRARALM